jgi:hypothetical protein
MNGSVSITRQRLSLRDRARAGLALVVVVLGLGACGSESGERERADSAAPRPVESGESAQRAEAPAIKPSDVRLCLEAHLNANSVAEITPNFAVEGRAAAQIERAGLGTMQLSFQEEEDEYGEAIRGGEEYRSSPIDLWFAATPTAAQELGEELALGIEKEDPQPMPLIERRGNVVLVCGGGEPPTAQTELIEICLGEAGPPTEIDPYVVAVERYLRTASDEEVAEAQRNNERRLESGDKYKIEVGREFAPIIEAEAERRGLD